MEENIVKYADVLNLDEQKRKEFLLNETRIDSNDAMNEHYRIHILKTLSEASRIEIIKSLKLENAENANIIMTLSEESRYKILTDNNIELYGRDIHFIVLSLNEELRYKLLKDNSVDLYDTDKENVLLSLNEEHRKELLKNNDDKQINGSFDEKEVEVDSTFLERTIDKLDEISRIKMIDKYFDTLDNYSKRTLIERLSEESKIYFLQNYSFNDFDKLDILRGVSEQAQAKLLEKSDNIRTNTSRILDLTEETKKKILKDGNIKCDAKQILASCSGETRREFLDSNILNLEPQERLEIIFLLDDTHREKYISTLSDEEKKVLSSIDSVIQAKNHPDKVVADIHTERLGLPEEMTIGVELEAEGKNANLVKSFGCVLPNWEAENDGSLDEGVEVVSPILHDNINDMKELEAVCNAMQQAGLETTENCGGHIHIGAAYFDNNPYAFGNLLTIWNECEELFYKMGNEKGHIPREGVLEYAKASHRDLETLSNGRKFSVREMSEFEKIQADLTDTEEKYRGLNLGHYGEEGKDTIEFRIPNGTINPTTVRENIKLFGSLMYVSKEMAINPEYKKEEFETLMDRTLTEGEKVEALLNLLFNDEKTKDIYRERWETVRDEKIFDELTEGQTQTFKRGDYSVSSKQEIRNIATSEEAVEQMSGVSDEIKREVKERQQQNQISNNTSIEDSTDAR